MPSGPLTASPSTLGARKNSQTILPVFAFEREHMPLATLEVSACIADVDQAVPGNRGSRHGLAVLGVGDHRLPQFLAGLEIEGEHAAVLRASKQHAVHIGGTAVGR